MKKYLFIGFSIVALIGLGIFFYLRFKKKPSSKIITTAQEDVISDVQAEEITPVYPDFIYFPPISVIREALIEMLDNVLAGIAVQNPQQLNAVDLSFLEDFDVPLHPVTGEPVFSNLYIGPNFRNQIGNPLKKGYTMLDLNVMIEGSEKQQVQENKQVNFVSTIPPKARVVSHAPFVNLALHATATAAEILAVDYSAYSEITGSMAGNIATFFNGNANKAAIGLVCLDIENGLFQLDNQNLANRLVAIYEAFKAGCEDYTKVSLLYQALPIQHIGFGVTRALYNAQPEPFWTLPASMTANAMQKNFPVNLIGKSLHSLPYIECIFEYYMYLQAFLPEGAILKNVENTPLKDWQGNDISVLTHFGTENPSYFHYAAHLASGIQVNKPHLNGKTLRIQTNHFNLAGNGYYGAVDNQPTSTKLMQSEDGMGRYAAPKRVVQAIALLSIFSGAKYYNWNDSNVITPVSRSSGEYVAKNEHETTRKDYKGVPAVQAAFKGLCTTEYDAGGGRMVTIAELIDGTEIYTDQYTKVNYLNVTNFSEPKFINPLDWKEFKLSPVLSIVNEGKGLVAILYFQAYDAEQSEFDYHYDDNGFNFVKRLQCPPNTLNISVFELGVVS